MYVCTLGHFFCAYVVCEYLCFLFGGYWETGLCVCVWCVCVWCVLGKPMFSSETLVNRGLRGLWEKMKSPFRQQLPVGVLEDTDVRGLPLPRKNGRRGRGE